MLQRYCNRWEEHLVFHARNDLRAQCFWHCWRIPTEHCLVVEHLGLIPSLSSHSCLPSWGAVMRVLIPIFPPAPSHLTSSRHLLGNVPRYRLSNCCKPPPCGSISARKDNFSYFVRKHMAVVNHTNDVHTWTRSCVNKIYYPLIRIRFWLLNFWKRLGWRQKIAWYQCKRYSRVISPLSCFCVPYQNQTSWVLSSMAALYWRVKGQGKKAIDCLRQALHHTPYHMKVSAMWHVSGMMHTES